MYKFQIVCNEMHLLQTLLENLTGDAIAQLYMWRNFLPFPSIWRNFRSHTVQLWNSVISQIKRNPSKPFKQYSILYMTMLDYSHATVFWPKKGLEISYKCGSVARFFKHFFISLIQPIWAPDKQVKGALSQDFLSFFISWIEAIWALDKQAKVVLLKSSFSREIRKKFDFRAGSQC